MEVHGILLAAALLAGDIACNIDSLRDGYRVGDAVELRVEIVNGTDAEVLLPGALDGSEFGRRYPHASFVIEGPDGPLDGELPMGCGNTNDLRLADFVRLAPGDSFDPHELIDNGGFWGSELLRGFRFETAGVYKFIFRYSTAAPNLQAWRGTPVCPSCPPAAAVPPLLARVPAVDLECSILVTVEPP